MSFINSSSLMNFVYKANYKIMKTSPKNKSGQLD